MTRLGVRTVQRVHPSSLLGARWVTSCHGLKCVCRTVTGERAALAPIIVCAPFATHTYDLEKACGGCLYIDDRGGTGRLGRLGAAAPLPPALTTARETGELHAPHQQVSRHCLCRWRPSCSFVVLEARMTGRGKLHITTPSLPMRGLLTPAVPPSYPTPPAL